MRRPSDRKKTTEALDSLSTSSLGRSLKVAKISVTAGAKVAGHALAQMFGDKSGARAKREQLLTEQVDLLVEELGKLKGSLMKAGQLVSMYGDYFFSPKLNKILKHLQADSTPVTWETMEQQLVRELGASARQRLHIEPQAYAAASLGQVHRATADQDPRPLCVKIQYPGIDKAIQSDLRALKPLLTILSLGGRGNHRERYEALWQEFREILLRELDYIQEREAADRFRAALSQDPRYVVPETLADLSSGRVLTTTFQDGVAPDDAAVLKLSQARRNALGAAMVDLYFREIFVLGEVQTDPHFGNFRVQIGAPGEPDRLVLLDFGSMRPFNPEFVGIYRDYVAGAFLRQKDRVIGAALAMGLLLPNDQKDVRNELFDLTDVLMEPLRVVGKGRLDPRQAADLEDFPRLISAKTRRFVEKIGMRPPPRELLLLDRKLLGVFVFLATIRALVPGEQIIGKYVDLCSDANRASS